ncbi:neuronal acetylcholine receptor subunit alpha-6-like isoform X2 [Homarus americanus]|uniref:neuronal acetylcholine receptor subunit alpha-6-like isoform X2 n=1 Tax=Homarus americanus TaxID=6706 RepID=UPI001C44CB84|nr:neuronal acetylcholine receptor subunit alpha-6-like isoform X2 [Homarus americanus]
MSSLAAVCVLLACVLLASPALGYMAEQNLRHKLLENYDKTSLPAMKTTVKFRMTIKHFDMIEDEQALRLDAWMVNEWVDHRLQWDPELYEGLEKLSFPHQILWKPDLDIYNSARIGESLSFGDTLLIVFSNGRVLFVPPVQLHFTCAMDLTYWPHDTHNCTLTIGSWVHDGHTIDPQIMDEKPEFDIPVDLTESGKNLTRGSWDVKGSNMTRKVSKYDCCPELYITLIISLKLQRNAPAYAWTVRLPAVGMCILTVVLFLLPPGAGEKLVFGGLCLILDLLFIAYTSNIVSHAPTHTPLIIELVCEQLLLVIGSVVLAAFTTRMARDPHTCGLPVCVRQVLLMLSVCLCLQNYKNLVARSHQPYTRTVKTEELEMGESSAAQLYGGMSGDFTTPCGLDWLLLAAVIDRICLIVFVAIFIMNMISFSAVL